MLKPTIKIRSKLKPLAWLYGIGIEFRNLLFDYGLLEQKEYPIPVICVGNITVGGTGKTPHIEYIIRLLLPKYKVAVVSRGYKRKSSSMQVVQTVSDVNRVGDEPMQIKLKYPEAIVVVDKDRRNAIDYLMKQPEDNKPDVILLDDGYQHRYVKPSLSILLMDSNRPIYEDELLPAGNLREPLHRKNRAGIVVVTKCKDNMHPIDFRIHSTGLNLFPYQSLFFTKFEYQDIQPIFVENTGANLDLNGLKHLYVLLVTGIATTKPIEIIISNSAKEVETMFFPDHHFFTKQDIKEVEQKFESMKDNKIIITTEKDAVRLKVLPYLTDKLKNNLYYIPIRVSFLEEQDSESFNNKIINHVRNY